MFSTAKAELKELMSLVRELAVYDTTLAVNPAIQPPAESRANRQSKELRLVELASKYEIL
ncbi:hypothetical protein [Undibacterium oligocarboniphilum]|uniref:Uncharacterized protein n=1 Tax=Undibacterium oligocarboniphilum TaxID=666702 RepID=A0A850QHZ1_9BURK|nr:hypothetical protein [Undibacterium oligocarboniphilum]MBC3871516.1 hypothetical protein [Undibacterium oligocarboniphilum]NVO78908.1 hypothetical protein [Undibacterium oligocarboniphilum]